MMLHIAEHSCTILYVFSMQIAEFAFKNNMTLHIVMTFKDGDEVQNDAQRDPYQQEQRSYET